MAQQEELIISVDIDMGKTEESLNDVINRIADLRLKQEELKDQYKAMAVSEEYYIRESKKLSQEISTMTRRQGNLTAAVQLSTRTHKSYGDSLDEMRAKLNDMQKAYAALSAEQRDSEGGKMFLKSIEEQDRAVKGLEKSIGDARRNVGNYEESIVNTIPYLSRLMGNINQMQHTLNAVGASGMAAFQGIIVAIQGATKAAIKFMLTPIGAIITGVALTIARVVWHIKILTDAIKKNDDAATAFARLWASLRPIMDGINWVLEKCAIGFGKVAGAIADFIAWMSKAAEASQELVSRQDELEEAERKYAKSSAENAAKIAKLRTEAKDREQYDAKERRDKILEAIELEGKLLEEEKRIAKEKYDLLVENNKRDRDASDEAKNKEAEALAEFYNIEAGYYTRIRELMEQRTSAENEYQAELAAIMQERFRLYEEEQRRLKELEEALNLLSDARREELEWERAGERAELLKEFGFDTSGYELEKQAKKLDEALENDLITREEYLQALKALYDKYLPKEEEEDVNVPSISTDGKSVEDMVRDTFGLDKEALAYYNELIQSGIDSTTAFGMALDDMTKRGKSKFAEMLGNMSDVFNDMADILNEYGENNEKAAKAAKAFALAGIIADQASSISQTALSISNAVEGASKAATYAGPAAPFVIAAYIGTMVGAVLAQLASTAGAFLQAKQLLESAPDAGKFASGGVVGGTSYTGDKLTAHVNSNEVILNPKQASNVLYQMANSPVSSGFDYEMLASAIAAQPAPVMVYKEYNDFKGKVATFNELAKI